MARLVLASASPRRHELLGRLGIAFEVVESGVPETPLEGEAPEDFALRAACEKALAVAARLPGSWVLGADTVVAVGSDILGKPGGPAEAAAMLRRLSGRTHRVLTAVALVDAEGRIRAREVVATAVGFRPIDPAEIEAYVASGEPLDKAGAYAIQAGAAGFVTEVCGSYTNVVGLPLDETREILESFLPGTDSIRATCETSGREEERC